jgi:hypothetical protein
VSYVIWRDRRAGAEYRDKLAVVTFRDKRVEAE